MIDPNALDLPSLWSRLAASGLPRRLLELARDEDLGDTGDLTAAVMRSASRTTRASLVAREAGVLSGAACLPMLAEAFGGGVSIARHADDGSAIAKGGVIATLDGDLAAVVRLERTMLNLLSRMSGVATLTKRYVDAVAGTRASILDTRKTTPGLRVFEKYAVRCGGGRSHRLGLHDAVLIKDNHIAGVPLDALASELARAARDAKANRNALFVEVEVDSLAQFARVLEVERGLIDFALLDNMSPHEMREAVVRRDAAGSAVALEASGGVRLETVRAIAETGVERISVGALTHSATSLDFGLDIA